MYWDTGFTEDVERGLWSSKHVSGLILLFSLSLWSLSRLCGFFSHLTDSPTAAWRAGIAIAPGNALGMKWLYCSLKGCRRATNQKLPFVKLEIMRKKHYSMVGMANLKKGLRSVHSLGSCCLKNPQSRVSVLCGGKSFILDVLAMEWYNNFLTHSWIAGSSFWY